MKNQHVKQRIAEAELSVGTAVELSKSEKVDMTLKPSRMLARVLSLSFVLTAVSAFTAACQPGPQGPAGAPGISAPSQSAPASGGSSDGGGFVSENSKLLLERVTKRLAKTVRLSSPAIFKDLPKPWTREEIAKAIEHVRFKPLKSLQRAGEDLMFNFGSDEKGPYVEALQPFFAVYGAIPIKFYKDWRYLIDPRILDIALDLELKLLHETAHLWGASEAEAEKFGNETLEAFDRDLIYCQTNDAQWLIQRGRDRRFYAGERKFSPPNPPGSKGIGLRDLYSTVSEMKKPLYKPGYIEQTYNHAGGRVDCDADFACGEDLTSRTPGIYIFEGVKASFNTGTQVVQYEIPKLTLEIQDTEVATNIKSVVASDGQPVVCEKTF